MDLTGYRRDGEAFLSALDREYYRHHAGLQREYAIEPIYERYGALFTAEAVGELRDRTAEAHGEARRGLTMLLDFAVDGFIGQATKAAEAELARREAGLELELDGRRFPFREAPALLANEADPDVRAAIEQARLEALERELGDLYRDLVAGQHAVARELGWSSYAELCAETKRVNLEALHGQTTAVLAATEATYAPVLEPQVRHTLGIGLSELTRADVPRLFRAVDKDVHFPADRLVPSFAATLAELGIDIAAQPGLQLDIERRPGKSPRAFCAPVRTPGEVYLVIAPVGGRDDYAALLHEGGHAEHAAGVDGSLPFEYRYLGDSGVSEAYAFLFQHLIEDPRWLERHLGVTEEAATELAEYGRAERLFYVRRYAAKLAYELELHASTDGPTSALAARYAELQCDAVKIEWPAATYLADLDPGFYCAAYLRAWAFEAQLRRYLRERFGGHWFARVEAGDELRRLWSEGQRRQPEELLEELTGAPLGFDALLEDMGAG